MILWYKVYHYKFIASKCELMCVLLRVTYFAFTILFKDSVLHWDGFYIQQSSKSAEVQDACRYMSTLNFFSFLFILHIFVGMYSKIYKRQYIGLSVNMYMYNCSLCIFFHFRGIRGEWKIIKFIFLNFWWRALNFCINILCV